eukprot:TRINITY_DN1830_c0_g1_i1.p2 TRINITY_DN1830_c0_g1~~TRINITY_DN1830_c0_g1_i1.p2  ORF type:complete len:356 (+),score=79.81 TRINITY_DN1830_c0_g1_i1:70-1137(+)
MSMQLNSMLILCVQAGLSSPQDTQGADVAAPATAAPCKKEDDWPSKNGGKESNSDGERSDGESTIAADGTTSASGGSASEAPSSEDEAAPALPRGGREAAWGNVGARMRNAFAAAFDASDSEEEGFAPPATSSTPFPASRAGRQRRATGSDARAQTSRSEDRVDVAGWKRVGASFAKAFASADSDSEDEGPRVARAQTSRSEDRVDVAGWKRVGASFAKAFASADSDSEDEGPRPRVARAQTSLSEDRVDVTAWKRVGASFANAFASADSDSEDEGPPAVRQGRWRQQHVAAAFEADIVADSEADSEAEPEEEPEAEPEEEPMEPDDEPSVEPGFDVLETAKFDDFSAATDCRLR